MWPQVCQFQTSKMKKELNFSDNRSKFNPPTPDVYATTCARFAVIKDMLIVYIKDEESGMRDVEWGNRDEAVNEGNIS